ncbi:sterile alpha motif domain-containing protein 13 isoform X1 [Gadus morhua]|nr:sterile alpha motif domain-containing protein 13 isoform X1 [Gadus morhua]
MKNRPLRTVHGNDGRFGSDSPLRRRLMKIYSNIRYSGMDEKANGSMDTKSPVENGQIADPANWGVADVVNYFKATGFEEQATAFQDQEIDGKSLLLMTRNDVLTGLSIKLGPALKIYEYHVKPLQTQHLKSNAS